MADRHVVTICADGNDGNGVSLGHACVFGFDRGPRKNSVSYRNGLFVRLIFVAQYFFKLFLSYVLRMYSIRVYCMCVFVWV